MQFSEFLEQTAARNEAVNLMFEERLFSLVGMLQRIAKPLAAAHIPYEVVGGLAVLIHIEEADPAQSMLTRDIDILIQRADLERVVAIAKQHGFRFRHAAGLEAWNANFRGRRTFEEGETAAIEDVPGLSMNLFSPPAGGSKKE